MATVTRKSVPVDDLVEETMRRLRRRDSPEHCALRDVTGISVDDSTSEAELLRALLAAGRAAIQEKAMSSGYAEWAATMDDEDRAYRRARRGWDRGEE